MDHRIMLLFMTMIISGACQQSTKEETQAEAQPEDREVPENSYWVYVSSGEADDTVGIGIYQWMPSEGVLKASSATTEVASSSYLALDTERERLYSINGDGIQSFAIDTKTGGLTLLNQVALSGQGGCHLSVSNDHQFLLSAYYSSGSVASHRLNEDGSVGEAVSVIQHQGSSINQERQEGAHAHMILSAPESDLVFVPDLGIDKVMAYRISADGVLAPAPVPSVSLDSGYGPRHMAFHPNKPFAYVLAELTGHVVGFKFDPERGLTEKINDVSTLPAAFGEANKSADIHITPDGKYLYASNRGPNSLAIFAIDQETGILSLSDILSCGGDWPRAFEIDPSGEYILVGNKQSDDISVQKIDTNTGLFETVGNVNTVSSPQCIRFIKKG